MLVRSNRAADQPPPTPPDEVHSKPGISFAIALIAVLTAGLLIGAVARLRPAMSVNDGSRWNTVWALTHGQGYAIGGAPYDTTDMVFRDGRHYSSKPALLPTLVAGLAWGAKLATGATIPEHDEFVNRLIVIAINIIPLIAVILLYARLLERLGYGARTRLFCVLTAALGTYLSGYSVTLNNHTVAACAVFYALYCLIRVECDGRREWRFFALCGLFAAWAVANEFPAGLFGLTVFGLLLRVDARRTLLFFAPGGLAVAAAFFYTTWLSTGSLTPYYLLPEVYFYEDSYWLAPQGIDSIAEPKLLYLFHLTLGHHGVLSLTPVFAIAFYGMLLKSPLRAINAAGLCVTVATLAWVVLNTRNYGGECQGARWLIWLIPFWLLGLPAAIEKHGGSRVFRALALAALLISFVSVGSAISGSEDYGTIGPWGPSWLHRLMRSAGMVGY